MFIGSDFKEQLSELETFLKMIKSNFLVIEGEDDWVKDNISSLLSKNKSLFESLNFSVMDIMTIDENKETISSNIDNILVRLDNIKKHF